LKILCFIPATGAPPQGPRRRFDTSAALPQIRDDVERASMRRHWWSKIWWLVALGLAGGGLTAFADDDDASPDDDSLDDDSSPDGDDSPDDDDASPPDEQDLPEAESWISDGGCGCN
jgi:hypothetical protein